MVAVASVLQELAVQTSAVPHQGLLLGSERARVWMLANKGVLGSG